MFRLHFQTPLLAGFQGFYQHKDKEDLEGGGKMKPFVLPGLSKEGPLLGHHSSPCLGDEFPGEQKETSPCTNVQLNFAPPQDLGSLRPRTRIIGCPVTTSFPNAWQKKMEYKDKNITLLFKLILFIMFFQVQFPDATFEETKMKEENHSRREIREADPPLLPALKLQDRLS